MNLYYELLQFPVFCVDDLMKYYRNIETARTALKRLLKEGLVLKIRNNMYTCISGESSEPVANRYQIGSAISDSAYISHHTAVEFHGAAEQVFYDVYVSSRTTFTDFEFAGYSYHYVPSKCSLGIIDVTLGGGIKVTDKERTMVDCIKDMDKIAGIEETLANVATFSSLSEEKILTYLAAYDNQFLYQKTGYILSYHKDRLKLSDHFFISCRSRIGKSKRYLTKDNQTGHLDKTWGLVVPGRVFQLKNGVSNDSV